MIDLLQSSTSTETRWSLGRSNIDGLKEVLREHWLAYAFLTPLFLYMFVFVWFAGLQGLVMSFFRWPLFGEKTFIGLGNYIHLLNWEVFYISFRATLLYGTQTIPQLILGVLMAMMVWSLDHKLIATAVSSIFLIPYVIPPIISGAFWRFLLHPNVGPVFKYLVNIGLLKEPIYWMSNGNAALAVIIGVGVWTWTPLVFLLTLAALQGIPTNYYEVAEVYGASKWEKFRYITFPQIKSTLLLVLILRIIWNLGKVAQPLQMTRGGPGFKTSMLGLFLYRLAWERKQFGLSFAVGVFLALVTIAIITVFIRKYEQESEIRI